MNEPIITRAALADLDDVWLYIALDDVVAADREIDLIYERISQLSEYPLSGHTRDDVPDPSLRFLTVHTYLIVYRADRHPVEIIRVLSGHRDLPAVLG